MGEAVWAHNIKELAVQKAIIKDICHEAIKPLSKIIYKLNDAQENDLSFDMVSEAMYTFSDEFKLTLAQFKKSAAQTLALKFGPQNWSPIIRKCIEDSGVSITNCTINIPENAFCFADPIALQFVTHEVIQNAVKHHPNHSPSLTIALAETLHEPGVVPVYQMIISDDGPGILSDQLNTLWDSENVNAQSGRNGLIAVNYLVTAMKGIVFVENNPTMGITLRLQLPKAG